MLDHLGESAEPARNDGCPARHRLDCRQAEELGDRDLTSVARHTHGRQGEDLRAAIEQAEVGLGNGAEELDTTLCGKPPKQLRIIAFGQLAVVSRGADDTQLGILGERVDQSVNAFMRRQPTDE